MALIPELPLTQAGRTDKQQVILLSLDGHQKGSRQSLQVPFVRTAGMRLRQCQQKQQRRRCQCCSSAKGAPCRRQRSWSMCCCALVSCWDCAACLPLAC